MLTTRAGVRKPFANTDLRPAKHGLALESRTFAAELQPGFRPMAYSTTQSQLVHLPVTGGAQASLELRNAFGVPFAVWDAVNGSLLEAAADQPGGDDAIRGDLVKLVPPQAEPQFVADEDSVVLLAIPLAPAGIRGVAVAPFATRYVGESENISGPARVLNCSDERAREWINSQTYWPVDALRRIGKLAIEKLAGLKQVDKLRREVVQISDNLANTYEEICLLHAVNQKLQLTCDDESLARMVVDRLLDSLPIEGVAIQFLPVARPESVTYKARTTELLVTAGECPIPDEKFAMFVDSLGVTRSSGPVVANNALAKSEWRYRDVRNLVVVPIQSGDRLFGWLAAFNHNADGVFGSVEANLLNSVASVLGTHAGNRDLYRQQAELLASVVRALSSAIDAKDPYTCGHSDRVARIAVRLAKEMGCQAEMLHTLYMAGLLHDVGKIGIKDHVLGKPGRLTDEEFEHIKQHPGLGYRILADIKQLTDILPAVLHHHEQWDGAGYPCALRGEQIPLIARIVAVADAYDAMSSDRPYRKGMAAEKVDEIFKSGAGKQWDPEVVDAFFAARDDIRDISRQERANLTLDVQQWS